MKKDLAPASAPASNDVQVIDAKQSAAILKRCEEKIVDAQKHLRRGEMMNDGLRFVIGLQLTIARPHVPLAARGTNKAEEGDGFEAWYKEKFGLEKSTASNWMRFSGAVLGQAEKSKSPTVGLLEKLPQQLTQGEFAFDMMKVTSAIHELMGDDGMMDFIDKHAERKPLGGSRQIKFTCPHCGAINKGFTGRTVKCIDATCAKKITVKPDGPSAQEKIQQIIEGEREVGDALIVDVEQWMAREHSAEFGRDGLQRMLATQIEWGKKIKALLKKKKGQK
jgi:hypothetical protein